MVVVQQHLINRQHKHKEMKEHLKVVVIQLCRLHKRLHKPYKTKIAKQLWLYVTHLYN
jgi:hypothetical protein